MPTIITHAVIPIALSLSLRSRSISVPLVAAGVVAAMLPDVDVLGFRIGVPYSSITGHRGFTHSLAFAALIGLVAAAMYRQLKAPWLLCFGFVFVAAASHGLLDMLTNAGRGVALFWPFTDHRYFFPSRVIWASPLKLDRLLGFQGQRILRTELLWVWLPAAAFVVAARLFRKYQLKLRPSVTKQLATPASPATPPAPIANP
jgi:inner membrane protein